MARLRLFLLVGFGLLCFYGLTAQRDRVEAFEIGSHNTAERPRGKEADGLIGDFVLRNNKIEALVAGNQPLRRANMSTIYEAPVPGCLYDLDLRGASNDQLTALRPGAEKGRLSWVRAVDLGSADAAAVEAVRSAAAGEGLYTRHEYRLERDWEHVRITSLYRNEGVGRKTITPRAEWKGLVEEAQAGETRTGDSVDAFDKRGYAWTPLDPPSLPEQVIVGPGEEKTFTIALAVADSPLAAYGILAGLTGDTGETGGRVADLDGKPAVHASLSVAVEGQALKHYPDAKGDYSFRLPAGNYELELSDIGRDSIRKTIAVKAGAKTKLDLPVSKASGVRVEIRNDQGGHSPGKVQFIGVKGTETPNLGTEYRAHGGDHQYQTHDGRFTQQLPPGDYLVRITHGPEYDLAEQEIHVGKGEIVEVSATMMRTVDTAGWISTDFHAHSTPSGDNYCKTDDRLINFAAEQLEFAPTTEHNRIYDWQPHIDRLSLGDHIRTVPGIELTGSGQHFNAFPLKPDPNAQNGGAPLWNYDPRINAIVLRNWPTPTLYPDGSRIDMGGNRRVEGIPQFVDEARWVQANHPTVATVFFDRDGDGVRDGGFVGFENLIDAAEVWSAEILNPNPTYLRAPQGAPAPNRTFQWLQMLNQGRHVWCVAVSDAHRIFSNGVGGWRTYVSSSTDQPAQIEPHEIIRNAQAGRMMISNGPYLEVTTGDGLPIGSSVIASGWIDLKIRVQAPNWIDVDRVQVLVNGRQPDESNFTAKSNPAMFRSGVVRFDETVRVQLQNDAHLIVAAVGESSTIEKGWGRDPKAKLRPVAYTNPIYVDVDGNGFQANGDNLGHPLPGAKE